MLSLSINKNLDYSSPIFFVPAYVETSSFAKASKDKTAGKPFNVPKKIAPSTSPIKKQTTTITQKTPSPKPTTVATSIPKKEEIKKEIVKQDVKKPEPIKQEVVQKPDVKKPEPIKEEVAKALDTQQTITPIVPENAHISNNYREVEALRKQAQLQKELVEKWKPPIGISPDCMCEISFFVTSKGTIENIKMVKNSGVVMFDISARQALFAMKMPQWTYGKPFTINFQSSFA